MKTKTCPKCKEKKPLSGFCKDKSTKSGYQCWCKKCNYQSAKNHLKNNPEVRERRNEQARGRYKKSPNKYINKTLGWRAKNRQRYDDYMWSYSLKKFNLTTDKYDAELEKQKGVCAICGKKETIKNQWKVKRLASDHNHCTNKFRGLLCQRCNTGIGSLRVDEQGIELLLKAIEYIRRTDMENKS
ncbi:MAG: hypothetical protein E3J87_09580 [Candidatus Cloacimonadota bacterium]|nr:MAG: hypothetical protein E3J87_09580 [Candidatus Cloacimonadota bacterium]